MRVFLCEKPSVAKEVAFTIGGATREDGYWTTSNGDFVTFAVGHLLEVAPPEVHSPNWKQWNFETLPMLPTEFIYQPNPNTAKQLKIVTRLLTQKGVTSIINACDCAREGELIFWLIYNYAQINHPVFRFWTSAQTREAIREALNQLKPASAYEGLKQAAFLRQEADWLVGLNATRAFTLKAQASGKKDVFSLGRVQTPTLKMIVDRDNSIDNFVVASFYVLAGEFLIVENDEILNAVYCNEKLEVIRLDDENEAADLAEQIFESASKPVIKTHQKKEVSLKTPQFYDLTGLQRKMNRVQGFTAEETMKTAQSLYEKKLISYPRTSSVHISQKEYAICPEILQMIAGIEQSYSKYAQEILDKNYTLGSRHVDDKKVSDHYALMPTKEKPNIKELSLDEAIVYEAIVKRFISAYLPAGINEQTLIVVAVDTYFFVAKGTVVISEGWRKIENDEDEKDGENEDLMPQVNQSSKLEKEAISPLERKTRPPKRLSDDSVLGLMQTAGSNIEDDEDAKEAMKDCGLGMAATRGEIIETLIRRGYLCRQKKLLLSTPKGKETIAVLSETNSVLVSPALTGKWEAALNKIARQDTTPDKFRATVPLLVNKIVSDIQALTHNFEFSSETNQPDQQKKEVFKCRRCLSEGRIGNAGNIKEITARDGNKYFICELGKDICGFISLIPKTKKIQKRLFAESCECGGFYIYKISKDKKDYFSCNKYPDCRKSIWFDSKIK